jgi:hypothetical protein
VLSGMTPDAAAPLSAKLSVGLGSHGVCYPCLGMVALEDHAERWVAPTLWVEGLGLAVGAAVERAVELGLADAVEARDDLRARGCRSGIFRAMVRRLAGELEQETQRVIAASLNQGVDANFGRSCRGGQTKPDGRGGSGQGRQPRCGTWPPAGAASDAPAARPNFTSGL